MRCAVVILSCLLAGACYATPGWDQHPGARLPLDVRLAGTDGVAPLARYFGPRPVVLVLGYFACANLCSANLQQVLAAASATGLPPARYRVLMVSIDPAEDPQLAARKRSAYRGQLASTGIALDLLTGPAQSTAPLAQAAGFRFARDAGRGLMHPAGFLVATPGGVVSRYFPQADVAPRDLRLALVEASGGAVGTVSDRIALACSHFDPATGRYTGMALALVRSAAVVALAMLAAIIVLARRRAGRQS
ncbi:SCO family protein [Massilia solisilvae]|uniref:SCO family protein n=1 Tax=Massilia solisilvae TaxID=1811225 RepID=A0ABT2BIM2_9BURK|nr:SCO family protein [Massilia solisilvae]MCS0608368.1 SCO family protein [Massilia solisilvae]